MDLAEFKKFNSQGKDGKAKEKNRSLKARKEDEMLTQEHEMKSFREFAQASGHPFTRRHPKHWPSKFLRRARAEYIKYVADFEYDGMKGHN